MKNNGRGWFKDKRLPEVEIMKLFWFVRTWDINFRGDFKQFQKIYGKIYPSIKLLKSQKIEDIDFNKKTKDKKNKDRIMNIFDKVTKCGKNGRGEWTDTSKILHCILPKLFVMWDVEIRKGIWRKNRKIWKRPKNDKFTGKEYAFYFLPKMKEEANNVIERYRTDHNHCTRRQAIKEISKKGRDHTIAKLLDEFNYVIYTIKQSPILVIYDLQIDLPLDGLATRSDLTSLSEERVTAKVRESLRLTFNNNSVTVACEAHHNKRGWKGHGTLNRKEFTWRVY